MKRHAMVAVLLVLGAASACSVSFDASTPSPSLSGAGGSYHASSSSAMDEGPSGTGGSTQSHGASNTGGGAGIGDGDPIGFASTDGANCSLTPTTVPFPARPSMASATYAREMLRAGAAPDPTLIDRDDFVALYPPKVDLPVTPHGAEAHFAVRKNGATGDLTLQIALRLATITKAERLPTTLAFVVDASSTMAERTGDASRSCVSSLDLAKRAMGALASQLKAGDTIHLISTKHPTQWATFKVDDQGAWNKNWQLALDALALGSPNALGEALDFVYGPGTKTLFASGNANRVVVLSDGATPSVVGSQSQDGSASMGGPKGDKTRDVRTIAVGVGAASVYDRTVLRGLVSREQGSELFLSCGDAETQALGKFFERRFDELVYPVVSNVSLALSLPIASTAVSAGPAAATGVFGPGAVLSACVPLDPGASTAFAEDVSVLGWDPIGEKWDTPVISGFSLAPTADAVSDKVWLVRKYADALRAPNPARLLLLHEQLVAHDPDADADLLEIKDLVTKHPFYPH